MTRDLLAAREVLRKRGWCQVTRERGEGGPCCARGALSVAVRGSAWGPLDERCHYAEGTFTALTTEDSVVDFNDADGRTQAEVDAGFEAAASLSLYGTDALDLP